jgi:hypothetical protein
VIRRFLDLSTGHLSPDTHAWLDAQLADAVLRAPDNTQAATIGGGKTRHGWFIYAPDRVAEGMPADLTTVLLKAREQGAEYVLLDCDAPPNPQLPILHPDFRD